MTFLHGTLAMAGVIGLLAPIIIHLLFRKRRRPVQWAAMKFLLAAYQRTRRRTQLEQWLLLLARCLIVLLLGAALARPFFRSAPIAPSMLEGGRLVYLLVDDGVAAGRRTGMTRPTDRTALQQHIETAQEIIASLGSGDRVSVIRMARPAAFLIDPPAVDHRAVSSRIEALTPADSRTDLPGALNLLSARLEEEARTEHRPAVVIAISEWLAGSAEISRPLNMITSIDLADHVTFLATAPATDSTHNTQIAAVTPLRHLFLRGPNDASQTMRVQLRRNGGDLDAMLTTITLQGNEGLLSPPRSAAWQAGQVEQIIDVPLVGLTSLNRTFATPGSVRVTAVIDEDALSADNRRSVMIEVQDALHIVVVARRETFSTGADAGRIDLYPAASWIRRALNPAADEQILIDDVDPASVSDAELRGADTVFLTRPDLLSDASWDALARYVTPQVTDSANNHPGLLWLFPSDSEQHAALWTDNARRALDLPWHWPREIERIDESRDETGWTLSDQQPDSMLLSLLQSELTTLLSTIEIHRRLAPESGVDPGSVILRMSDDKPFLLMHRPTSQSAGLILYQSAAARLDWTSLPAKPLLVALIQEVMRQGISMVRALPEARSGDRPVLVLPTSVNTLVGPDNTVISLRPVTRNEPSDPNGRSTEVPMIADPIRIAGLYHPLAADGSPSNITRLMVQVDSAGCDTTPQTESQIASWLSGTGQDWAFASPEQFRTASTMLWKEETSRSDYSLAALLCLFMLLALETLMARRFSHAESSAHQHGLPFHGVGDGARNTINEMPAGRTRVAASPREPE